MQSEYIGFLAIVFSIIVIFKKFVDNNRIFGFKGKLPLIREIIDEPTSKKFENLFYSLNLLYEEINSLDTQRKDNDIFKGKKKFTQLTSNELQVYHKYFDPQEESDLITNITEFNENQQLLELALDEVNNDHYLLDLEIEKMEEEIALNEQLLANEVTDNDLLKKKKKNINNNNSDFFEHKITNYKKNYIDVIKQDTIILNKTLSNIVTELDLNLKKSALLKDNQSYIVGHRKINDTQFDESMKLLIDIIYQFEFNYDKIQRKLKMEKEEKIQNSVLIHPGVSKMSIQKGGRTMHNCGNNNNSISGAAFILVLFILLVIIVGAVI